MPKGETAADSVLDALYGNEVPVNPTILTWYLNQLIDYNPPSRTTVENALDLLEAEDLVENPYKSYWRITERGRAYMDGEISVDIG